MTQDRHFSLPGGLSQRPRISILGDSYSTFEGIIPSGNNCYYPQPGNDVLRAEECWWHMVIEQLGGILEKNESWSGSFICYTGYGKVDVREASFVTRLSRLGNPDVILICGATNDNWGESPLGDFRWSDWTTEELFSFRPAMSKMLADLQAGYPGVPLRFILNSEMRPEINESVDAICRHYGVPYMTLHDIEKIAGHPSKAGMRAFAEQVVAALHPAM